MGRRPCPIWSRSRPRPRPSGSIGSIATPPRWKAPSSPERQAGAVVQAAAHAARFALILSRLRLACDPCPPDGEPAYRPRPAITVPPVAADVQGAVKLVDYFKSHLARIGHQMTAGIGNADAKALVDWIKRHRLTMFRERKSGSIFDASETNQRTWPPPSMP